MYLVHNQTMMRVNIADAKTHLSRYLRRVKQGEVVVLCRRNVPVAEIRPPPKPLGQPRPAGIDRGMTIPPSFFEPLPRELLDVFSGDAEPA